MSILLNWYSKNKQVTMVTKFPNHWWASSCPTTSATHCLEDEQEFFGSISRAVSL